ncbi:MAG TPA: acyltransferase [Acidimicrobiales bacterium]|nr:acyltransferase [Acidimicrobiales bacterium]
MSSQTSPGTVHSLEHGYLAQDPHRGFRPDIQGLRALAVLLVIGNHAGVPGFAGAFIGVDIFFVISGYVITKLLLGEATKGMGRGLADFYSRRIRRIVPAATATLVGTLVVAGLALGVRMDPNLPGDVRWASAFAADFRFISTNSNYFVPGIHPSLVTQFWSLAVEEQFYLAFPLVVFLIARYVRPHRRLRALSIALVVGIVLSAWYSIQISPGDPVVAYYSPFTRFWELGLGGLLATLSTGRPTRTVRTERLAVGFGVVLLAVAMLEVSSTSVYPGWQAWMPCGASALMLWAGLGGVRTPITRVLSTRPLRYLGDISYSLYLTHYVWLVLPGQLPSPLIGWKWRCLELGATALSAMCLYHLLENPIRRSPRLAADRVAVVLTLGVCIAGSWMAAIAVARVVHLV